MATLSLIVHLILPFMGTSRVEPEHTYSRLQVGMSTQQLFNNFGTPEGSSKHYFISGEERQYFFRGSMCQWQGPLCSVSVKQGRVVSSLHVKPAYTEEDVP